jgi:uncharacterized repeat protein (TIGR01451 family)
MRAGGRQRHRQLGPSLAPGATASPWSSLTVAGTPVNASISQHGRHHDTNNGLTGTTTVTVPLIFSADLAIAKFDTPRSGGCRSGTWARATLTYTPVYTNNGPSDARFITVTDVLPAGVTFGGVVAGPVVAASGQTLSFYTPTLAAGASERIVLTVTVNPGAAERITNTATITSSTPDLAPANNTFAAPTTVLYADVDILKDAQPRRPVIAGETITWVLTIGNQGGLTAENVYITDTLSAGMTYNGIVSQPAGITGPNVDLPLLSWFTPTLAPGARAQILFTVTALAETALDVVITNTARITTTTPQTNTTNEVGTTQTPRIDLEFRKRADRSSVIVGELIQLHHRIDNTGGFTLTTVPLTDTLTRAI